MGFTDRPIALLARYAANRAVAHATAAENADRRYRPAALEAAIQADDAAVLASLAVRRRDRVDLLSHLHAARRAASRARDLEREARLHSTRDLSRTWG